jgi:hypothetical protein
MPLAEVRQQATRLTQRQASHQREREAELAQQQRLAV